MVDEADEEVTIGLSEEERADLQELIKAFNDERSVTVDEQQDEKPSPLPAAAVHEQIKDMSSHIADFGDQVLKLNTKVTLTAEDTHKRFQKMNSGIVEFGEKLLKLDTKMKSFYKILLLCYKKTELMNKRIDASLEIMADGMYYSKSPLQNVSEPPVHK